LLLQIIYMPIQLEIDDEQVEILKEIYSTKASQLSASIAHLQAELQKINPMLIQLGLKTPKLNRSSVRQDTSTDYLNEPYSDRFTWEQKAMFILSNFGEMTAKQIIEKLISEYEPNMDKNRAMNSLPATMSVMAKDEKIERRNENGEYVYSLPVTKE
jgi:hypothetical protein